MTTEQTSFRQLDLISGDINFNAEILESDWTRFAKEKDVRIAIRPLIPKRPRFGPRPSAKSNPGIRRLFVPGNEWNRYLDKYSIYKLTIEQYKSRNKNKRPDWALTYQEKKNKTFDKNNQIILGRLETKGTRFRSAQREQFYDVPNCVAYGAVRFTDAAGHCERIIVIYPDDDSKTFHARQEDWNLDNGKWDLVSNITIDKNGADDIYNTFGRTMSLTS